MLNRFKTDTMAQTFSVSRLLSKRIQFSFPGYSWVLPNINIHTDSNKTDSLIVSGDPALNKDKDILLANIRQADNSKELFNIIAAHGQLFNQRHVIESLSCLHEFNKSKEFDPVLQNVIKDPVFEKLCIQLKKYSRILELNEIIEALKVLALLNVPSNSTIFQMLLQLIRSNINNLELDQVVFLDYLLKKCETNHLIDAIQLALPLIFQLQLTTKMDRENVGELTKLLRYASTNNIPMNHVTSIVTSLVIHTSDIDPTSAKGILLSLTEHRFKNCQFHIVYEKLIKKCCNTILYNMNKVTFLDILRILERLKEMIILGHNQFYELEFFNACGDYVIEKKLPFASAIQVIRIFTRVAHCHIGLLDYISQLLVLESESIEVLRPRQLMSLTNALSNANYIPEFFDEIKENIIGNPILNSTKIELPWAKIAMDLAVLGIYKEDFIKRVFSLEFLKEYLSRKNTVLDYIQLLVLYQAVKAFHPSIQLEFPDEVYQKAVGINCNKTVDKTMKASLIQNLGGEEYFASQVQMPYGILADFVVAFRDGIYPIAINPDKIDGPVIHTDLKLPPESQVLCILNYHRGCFSINNKRLRGQFDLINRSLEKLGYKVFSFSLPQWLEMTDVERTLYLMREIKYKYAQDDNIIVSNN